MFHNFVRQDRGRKVVKNIKAAFGLNFSPSISSSLYLQVPTACESTATTTTTTTTTNYNQVRSTNCPEV